MRAVLFVLLAYAVVGALAGVVWQWIWTRRAAGGAGEHPVTAAPASVIAHRQR